MWQQKLNPKGFDMFDRSIEVGKALRDYFNYEFKRLWVAGCEAHHKICDQHVKNLVGLVHDITFIIYTALFLLG